jgi:hypothetical protein
MNFSISKIGGWLFTAAGAVTLFCAMISWFHIRSFLQSSKKADGYVMRLVDASSGNGHYAIYGFRDADEKFHRVYTDVIAGRPTKAQPRDEVTLLYQPDHPGDAELYTFWNVWARPVELCVCGALSLLFGLGVLAAARSQ